MSARVLECDLPAQSRLHSFRTTRDFLDCYAVTSSMAPRAAAEVIVDFPGWARGLLQVRRVVTAPFGLSQDGPDAPDKLGPFPVEYEDDQEIVAGFDDKHLNFRVSVMSVDRRVHLATWVDPHNVGGRAYLSAIMPFHIAIARNALARVAEAGAVAA